jgi:hypothetical protein
MKLNRRDLLVLGALAGPAAVVPLAQQPDDPDSPENAVFEVLTEEFAVLIPKAETRTLSSADLKVAARYFRLLSRMKLDRRLKPADLNTLATWSPDTILTEGKKRLRHGLKERGIDVDTSSYGLPRPPQPVSQEIHDRAVRQLRRKNGLSDALKELSKILEGESERVAAQEAGRQPVVRVQVDAATVCQTIQYTAYAMAIAAFLVTGWGIFVVGTAYTAGAAWAFGGGYLFTGMYGYYYGC